MNQMDFVKDYYSRVPCVLCLGYFDGVHIGHQALLKAAREAAKPNGWKVIAHTFSVSPKEVITGKRDLWLTGKDERCAWLKNFGADDVLCTDFNEEIMLMSGEEYLDNVLMKLADIRHIVAGEDHRFGYLGKTGKDELRLYCIRRGIGLSIVEQVVTQNGEKVSSSGIRAAIAAGNCERARELLGHDICLLNEIDKR